MLIFNCSYEINWGSFPDWIMIFITGIGIIVAIRQFILYRREIKNKTFIEFRQRFKTDPINIKVLEYLNVKKSKNKKSESNVKPTCYEINHFVGFYEELHKMLINKLISIDDLIYFFGNYYFKVFEDTKLISCVKLQSHYWARAIDLYIIMKKHKNDVLSKIKTEFNVESNLELLKKKSK